MSKKCVCIVEIRKVISAVLVVIVIGTHSQRVCLSVAIIDMTKFKNFTQKSPCNESKYKHMYKKHYGTMMKWTESEQEIVLLSYYIGYAIGHIPFGYLCDFQVIICMIVGQLLSIIGTGLIPMVINLFHLMTPLWTIIPRIIVGLGQAVIFPGITVILGAWIPKRERATTGAIVYSASALGNIAGTLITGLIIEYFGDWSYVFYFWSLYGLATFCLFIIFVRSHPNKHPFIMLEELKYLETAVIQKNVFHSYPFKKILVDIAFWACLAGHFGYAFLYTMIQTNTPIYMNKMVGLNLVNTSIVSSVPYVGQFISSIFCGLSSDYFTSKNIKTAFVRKAYTIIAILFPTCFQLALVASECNQILVVSFFTATLFCTGAFNAGLKVSIMDMSINYCGFLMAIMNGIASTGGILSPLTAGLLTRGDTFHEWRIVYLITFGVSNSLLLLYVVFGNGSRRKWDHTEQDWNDHMQLRNIQEKRKWWQESVISIQN